MFERWFGRRKAQKGLSLPGDLWLDRPDAKKQIGARLRAGTLSEEQSTKLTQWVDDGFFRISIDLAPSVVDELNSTVDRLWKEKPASALYAFDGLLTRFVNSDENRERRSPYRVMEMHGFSEAALSLYLNRQIFDWVELLFGEPAVATQSIYFEFGSQQGLHRDPVFVQMTPASHLAAVWIALEDIQPGSGELIYVPGSHRLPYYELAPGRWVFDFGADGPERMAALETFDRENRERAGLEPRAFLPKRGEVLFWHASLMHGGSPVTNPSLTRRSFVVHFTTLQHHKSHSQLVVERTKKPDGTEETEHRVHTTRRVIESNGCHGFATALDATE